MYKQFIQPILYSMSHETAHSFFLILNRIIGKSSVARGIVRFFHKHESASLHRELFGLDFKNPVGLAAGFDTNAEAFNSLSDFGFSFIEIGSLSPEAQEGAPKPRMVRAMRDRAIITKLGIRNKGVRNAIANIQKNPPEVILAGSIIPNSKSHKDDEIVKDYETSFSLLYDFVDFIVVNMSCPNEQGLQTLQDKDSFAEIIDPLLELRMCYEKTKPILVKVSPDIPHAQLDEILDYCMYSGIDGIVAGNYARLRPGHVSNERKAELIESGFISGAPIFEQSLELVKHINEHTKGRFPIIGCGGIMSPEQAKEMLAAGASLIQLYTGIIYDGPRLVKNILKSITQK